MLRPPWQWREERRVRGEAREALELVGLADHASDSGRGRSRSGSYGCSRSPAALAQRPTVLLLDEPAAGLRAAEKEQLVEALQHASRAWPDAVLVEHDMQFVGALADRVVVLDRGRVIADGTPAEVRDGPARDRGVPRVGTL